MRGDGVRELPAARREREVAARRLDEQTGSQQCLDRLAKEGPGRRAELAREASHLDSPCAQAEEDRLAAGGGGVEPLARLRLRRAILLDAAQVAGEVTSVRAPHAERRIRIGRIVRTRADAEREHRSAFPVAAIVNRLEARPRVVRKLVAAQPGGPQPGFGLRLHAEHEFFIGSRELPALGGDRERRPRLDRELVGRNVLGGEAERFVQVALETGEALARGGENQIEGDRVETRRAAGCERETRFLGAVGSAEAPQHRVVEGLDADRESCDARCAESRQPLALEGTWIHLERRLDVRVAGECRAHRPHDLGDRLRLQQRRRAAAQIQAREPPTCEHRAPRGEFAPQRRHVPLLGFRAQGPRGLDREIAVGANALAEWHVHVDSDARVAHGAIVVARSAVRPPPGSDTLGRAVSSPDIHREVLPSGPSVLLREARLAPVVELQIWCRAGSADERPDEAGLAHFHEHMLFKGTRRRGVGQVAGDIEGAGGQINAYTSFDVTVYHATLPSDQLEVGIDVLTDAVLNSTFEPEEITREIEVVLEEIRRGEDSPSHVLGDAVFEHAFQSHPYRAPILGPPSSVAAFDRARVQGFFERWYAPDQLTVVAAGDFDRALLLARLQEAFAGGKPSQARRVRSSEAPQHGLRSFVLPRRFERASLELAWRGVALGHPDAALLDLLAFVLGCGESSRLVQRVKEHAELVDRINASCFTPLDPGLFSISVETDSERASEALAAAVREVETLRNEPVSAEELDKARTNFLASEHFARESVSGLAQKLGGFELLAGDYRAEARYLESVRKATPADLLRVAREHLAPEVLTVGAVLPEAEAGALDSARIEAAVAAGTRQIQRAFAIPRRAATPGPAIGYSLANGARLFVLPRRDVPVVAVRAGFLGGQLAEDAGSAGLSSFLASMWTRGTEQRSAADFARATESLAAEIDGYAGRSSLGLTLETTRESFAPAFDLFAEALLEPGFGEAELARERSDTLASIERREDRLAQRTYLLFSEAHYRSHPYRLPLRGSAESVATFDAARVRAHHERLVRARNLVIAVAGDVDPDDTATRVASRLADLDAAEFAPAMPPEEEAPREIRRAVLRKQRSQSHLVIGFRGLSVRDEDRFALELVTQILAGQAGRLFLELRDRRSLAYSVTASNLEGVAPGIFTVYIATAPEKREEAQARLLEQLEELVQTPPAPDELGRAQRFLVGSFAIDRQRNAVHAAHTALDVLYGLGPDAADGYAERILRVTPEDVLRVARRVIQLDAYTLAAITP